ncbi:MAG: FtsQ-type POTRA domain-containing protein [Chitinophagaceae bacterium]|nr:FtsQ-type POTRA domain-containing protein [Chitinophagaceae bacterium]
MEKGKRYGIKNILLTSFWICLGAGMIVLLVAAIRKKDARNCQGIDITISGVNNNFFVDKGDILNTITALSNGNPVGRPTGSFNLKKMEAELEKNVWIKEAEMFFDNNETLFVKVTEREPVARIFSVPGSHGHDRTGGYHPATEFRHDPQDRETGHRFRRRFGYSR